MGKDWSLRQKNDYSLDTLLKIAHDLKKKHVTIGLAHGAFDLFHYAHLYLLRQSAKLCDFFIVGVDSDENISKYKSYKRPINDEHQRVSLIKELKCVDAAFINRTDLDYKFSYAELYKELKVDVVTIGTRFQFPESAKMQASKAHSDLVEIDTPQNPSTTAIIESILAKYEEENS